MMDFIKSDTPGGRFLLITRPGLSFWVYDRFVTFIAFAAVRELFGLRRSIVNCVMPSGRLRKKRLLEIIEQAKKQLEGQ